jgi:malate/lactate dehydrogenase
MKVGIVGNGMVGSAMAHLFPEALIWDIDPERTNSSKEEINKCDVAFVCVPTDGNDAGYDYGPLEKTIDWLESKIIV